MPPVRASIGASQPKRLAPRFVALSDAHNPTLKNQNLCAEVLGDAATVFVGARFIIRGDKNPNAKP
jgi:hypothetical protein